MNFSQRFYILFILLACYRLQQAEIFSKHKFLQDIVFAQPLIVWAIGFSSVLCRVALSLRKAGGGGAAMGIGRLVEHPRRRVFPRRHVPFFISHVCLMLSRGQRLCDACSTTYHSLATGAVLKMLNLRLKTRILVLASASGRPDCWLSRKKPNLGEEASLGVDWFRLLRICVQRGP